MTIKLMKRCSTSLVTKVMQIETTGHPFKTTRTTRSKRIVISLGKHVKISEPSYTAGGNVKWYSYFWKQFGAFSQTCKIVIMWLSSFTPRWMGNENVFIQNFVHRCSWQHYSQWPNDENNPNVHRLIHGKWSVAYLCNGILLGAKK